MNVPHDPHAEKALLATLCAPGSESIALECCAVLHEDDFLVPAHRVVFSALRELLDAGCEINLLTLRDHIRTVGKLNIVGEITGISSILSGEEVGRPFVLVGVLQEARIRRSLVRVAGQVSRDAQDDLRPTAAILENLGQEVSRLSQDRGKGGAEQIVGFSDNVLADLHDRMQGISTVGTKFRDWPRLNGVTHGFQPGNLIILAARPGVGKTALALNWVVRAAKNRNPVLFFSLEMSREECLQRMMADLAGVNIKEMIESKDNVAFAKLAEAKNELDNLPIFIADRANITAREITAQVDKAITRHQKLGLVVVDYLQLVSSPEGSSKSEVHRLGDISRSFKLLAKDRHVPVLVLSQLNREVEKRQGGKPQLSDLRDSGAIEQDADIVMFIHREMQPRLPSDGSAQLLIAKHRNGPTLSMDVKFLSKFTRYEECQRETVSNYIPEYRVYEGMEHML